MRNKITRSLSRLQRTFSSFSTGQKAIAVIGGGALLLAGIMVFRWAATPSYSPLFNDVAPADASAIIEQLESEGTPYELVNGGATIMVPRDMVYDTRIRLSGEGLPADESAGYALLDDQDISTSEFQEQTDFKRAMEGELAATIESLDDVDTAVVHVAMPEDEIFADEQQPTTASVLVSTAAGTTLAPEQVQAVIHLVSSSIDGLEPDNVTIADATGQVLSAPGDSFGAAVDTQSQQVETFEKRINGSVQSMLDRVVGAGNSAVQVTANLNFDKTVTDTTRYFSEPDTPPLSESETTETYTAPNGAAGGGVVGPDGQLDPGAAAGGADAGATTDYRKRTRTADNSVNREVEHREAAPGAVESLNVGIVLDAEAAGGMNPEAISDLVTSGLGIDQRRGDTIEVSVLPFDRSAEELAAEELAAAEAAAEEAEMMSLIKNGGLALLVLAILLLAYLRGRKRNKAREDATTYMVEQLRRDAVERTKTPVIDTPPAAALALDVRDPKPVTDMTAEMRNEITAMVERQPEDVASLLRGWLVERGV